MNPKLSDDLRHAIEISGGCPVSLDDAATNVAYVLLRADQHRRLHSRGDRGNERRVCAESEP